MVGVDGEFGGIFVLVVDVVEFFGVVVLGD